MKGHLEAAVKRDKRKQYLISPLSKCDALIVTELIESLGRIEAFDLRNIIEEWKYLKDETILSLLTDLNNKPIPFEDDEETKREFINFDGVSIEVTAIKRIDVVEDYNYTTTRMEYYIIINKDFPDNALISDLRFTYFSSDLRSKRMEYLNQHLSKYIRTV